MQVSPIINSSANYGRPKKYYRVPTRQERHLALDERDIHAPRFVIYA